MSSEAPFPKASSMLASLLTNETRMGVKLSPSRSSSPLVKAAAEVWEEEATGKVWEEKATGEVWVRKQQVKSGKRWEQKVCG
jgi:hypothetical protein